MTLCLLVTSFNSSVHLDRFFNWMDSVNGLFAEVIIMDDCSDDGSYRRICRESANYSNVVIHRALVNSGRPSVPRNEGLKLVTAERVVFLDIDDLIPINYLKFLYDTSLEHCFSGTKLTCDEWRYNIEYSCDLSFQTEILPSQLRRKNLVTLSGASILTVVARKYQFPNEPLEDWDYWVCVSDQEESIKFIKFLDVPIYYDVAISLSPRKFKQILRVVEKSGIMNLVYYAFYTLKLKYIEKKLNVKYTRACLK